MPAWTAQQGASVTTGSEQMLMADLQRVEHERDCLRAKLADIIGAVQAELPGEDVTKDGIEWRVKMIARELAGRRRA